MRRAQFYRWRHVARDRRGIAAVEFALIASMVLTLLLGAYDIGNAVQQYTQLNAAVRAGGQYAISFPTDSTGIAGAVAASLPTSLQPPTTTVTVACECYSGGGASTDPCSTASTQTNCSLCTAGTTERFVHVLANVSYTWLATPFPITALTATQACYVARVQ